MRTVTHGVQILGTFDQAEPYACVTVDVPAATSLPDYAKLTGCSLERAEGAPEGHQRIIVKGGLSWVTRIWQMHH
jgi:hypothetical protein